MSLRFHLNAIDAILGTGCGTQGQSYVELLQGDGMISGSRYRNCILCRDLIAGAPIQWSGIVFREWRQYDLLSNVDILNLLLRKAIGGDTECFIIFSWFGVCWLLAGGWWRLGAESLI